MDRKTKRIRFEDSAQKRTNKVIRAIRTLGHCSNKSIYVYDDEDVTEIFSAINKELNKAKERFKSSRPKDGPDFKLSRRSGS